MKKYILFIARLKSICSKIHKVFLRIDRLWFLFNSNKPEKSEKFDVRFACNLKNKTSSLRFALIFELVEIKKKSMDKFWTETLSTITYYKKRDLRFWPHTLKSQASHEYSTPTTVVITPSLTIPTFSVYYHLGFILGKFSIWYCLPATILIYTYTL